jgi:hypothetical protein
VVASAELVSRQDALDSVLRFLETLVWHFACYLPPVRAT